MPVARMWDERASVETRGIGDNTSPGQDPEHTRQRSSALGFALRASDVSNLTIFALALGLTAVLVVLQQGAVHLVGAISRRQSPRQEQNETRRQSH